MFRKAQKFLANKVIPVAAAMILWMASSIPVFAGNTYLHDPRFNEKAMVDIQYDEDAVYGFVPRADSARLSGFLDIDFTDPIVVAECQEKRREYHAEFEEMYDLWEEMLAEGQSSEEIAKVISPMRNEIRLASYEGDAEGLATVKDSNLKTYGNENGPTPEQLYEEFGSWDMVVLKCFSANSGMDACLGLYDEEYEHNVLTGAVVESDSAVYTVMKGDYLAKIAFYYYGDESRWPDIYKANKGSVKNANIIYEGMQLRIPIG